MLVGLANNFPSRFKLGEFVYVYHAFNVMDSYSTTINDSGYGVIVDTSHNELAAEYLVASTLIGVLINGKISWYAPHEIHRVESRNVG
jgi:hypothetical protein